MSMKGHAEHRGFPCYWGYDTGSRMLEVRCFCGKLCLSHAAYEQHMKAKHPGRLRALKQCGCWQQYLLDGWARRKHGRSRLAQAY